MQPFVNLLFHILRYVIADNTVFSLMTSASAYASQAEIFHEFVAQFSEEFHYPAANQYYTIDFDFRRDWDAIQGRLEQFEREHPILGYWKNRDAACQTFWP
jgi:hypothetical protein